MKSQNKPLYLGIDTNIYTTSIALILDNGRVISLKNTLPVKKGQRNLKQSEALFKHLKNLPEMFEYISKTYDLSSLRGVGASTRPRPILNSYMPVFEGGKEIGRVVSSLLDIPFIELSHQENHIESVVFGAKVDINKLNNNFLAVHFSGDISEILNAKLTNTGYDIKRIAGSLDVNSGQLIDSVGVRFGYSSPAGKELEYLAKKAKRKDIFIPTNSDLKDFRFSAQENYINNLIDKNRKREEIAYGIFEMIARTLSESIYNILEEQDFNIILFCGGVMSNTLIRDNLIEQLSPTGLEVYFASPEFSRDNAIGNASIVKRILEK